MPRTLTAAIEKRDQKRFWSIAINLDYVANFSHTSVAAAMFSHVDQQGNVLAIQSAQGGQDSKSLHGILLVDIEMEDGPDLTTERSGENQIWRKFLACSRERFLGLPEKLCNRAR